MVVLLGAGCAAETAIPGQPPSVTILRLEPESTGLRAAPGLSLLAAYRITGRDPRFGGFSAVETDGQTLWLLSDRATLWRAAMNLDRRTGDLVLGDWQVGRILPDAQDRRALDSEALARDSSGQLYVAFEHDDSVRLLQPTGDGDWRTQRLHDGRLVEGSPRNQGLEALALLDDGSLVAISEGAREGPAVARGARLVQGRIEPFGYRTGEGFSPVGADVLEGRLYVLERAVGLVAGWQTRLTRNDISGLAVGGIVEGEEILRITAGDLAENHEGVALLAGEGDGEALIVLVSDDNQSALQRTLLLFFRYAR